MRWGPRSGPPSEGAGPGVWVPDHADVAAVLWGVGGLSAAAAAVHRGLGGGLQCGGPESPRPGPPMSRTEHSGTKSPPAPAPAPRTSAAKPPPGPKAPAVPVGPPVPRPPLREAPCATAIVPRAPWARLPRGLRGRPDPPRPLGGGGG